MSDDPREKPAQQGLGMIPATSSAASSPQQMEPATLGEVSQQVQEGNRFADLAQEMYPYLKNYDVPTIVNPQKNRGWAETYAPDEPGAPEYPRPQGLPMGKLGLEIYRKDMRPIDYLGEVVSHHAVDTDPKVKKVYGDFAKTMNHAMTVPQYLYARKNFGENRPYNQWYTASGLPGYVRGQTFNQWQGADGQRMYTGQQLEMLRGLQKLLGIIK